MNTRLNGLLRLLQDLGQSGYFCMQELNFMYTIRYQKVKTGVVNEQPTSSAGLARTGEPWRWYSLFPPAPAIPCSPTAPYAPRFRSLSAFCPFCDRALLCSWKNFHIKNVNIFKRFGDVILRSGSSHENICKIVAIARSYSPLAWIGPTPLRLVNQ